MSSHHSINVGHRSDLNNTRESNRVNGWPKIKQHRCGYTTVISIGKVSPWPRHGTLWQSCLRVQRNTNRKSTPSITSAWPHPLTHWCAQSEVLLAVRSTNICGIQSHRIPDDEDEHDSWNNGFFWPLTWLTARQDFIEQNLGSLYNYICAYAHTSTVIFMFLDKRLDWKTIISNAEPGDLKPFTCEQEVRTKQNVLLKNGTYATLGSDQTLFYAVRRTVIKQYSFLVITSILFHYYFILWYI